MRFIIVAFLLGWSAGASVMYWHFYHSKLIRSRNEWFAAQKRKSEAIEVKDE